MPSNDTSHLVWITLSCSTSRTTNHVGTQNPTGKLIPISRLSSSHRTIYPSQTPPSNSANHFLVPSPKNEMASTSAIAMAIPLTSPRRKNALSRKAAFNAMKLSSGAVKQSVNNGRLEICASMKEKAVTGLSALALSAIMVIPDVAEAAQPGLSPSLKNFLLSIVSGGVVLGVLVGAVVGVANFDPVKRA